MFGLFKLSEKQQSFLNLVNSAIASKSYTIERNYYFYDEGQHHSFDVKVHLSNGVDLFLTSLYVGNNIYSKMRSDEKFGHLPGELYSSKAYKAVRNHMRELIAQEEQAKERAIEDQRNKVLNSVF